MIEIGPTNILFALCVAHAICDYPLQGDFLARAKNPAQPLPGISWQWAMAAHCAIHAGAVAALTGSVFLGLCEFIAHWLIDRAKCMGDLTFSQDQKWHIASKCAWAICYTIARTAP